MPPTPLDEEYDYVVIGSGFGGSMVAHGLVAAGRRVLMLERGGWVERGAGNWHEVRGFFQSTPAYVRDAPYMVRQRRGRVEREGICACVGGPSVFYGGASFRFREGDFEPPAEIVAGSAAAWPIGYEDLEPHYTEAERLLGVAGEAGIDPTEPHRSAEFPCPPAPLTQLARRIGAAATDLGLHPFRIPLALNVSGEGGNACVMCLTCDAYACAIGAKNDLATRLIAPLLARGLELRTGRVATRLVEERGRIAAVECYDVASGERERYRARRVVLAAGALASPHLILASGLELRNPGRRAVGRYLMRHCNAFVYGVFRTPPDPERRHHKQLAIHDFYFGDGSPDSPPGKLGNIQQIMAPQTGAVLRKVIRRDRPSGRVEAAVARGLGRLTRHMTGLQVIAEDQPQEENRVELLPGFDRYGLPRVQVHHRYTARDVAARAALVRHAREILTRAGALTTIPYMVTTFSHAVGSLRMGPDPKTSVLDEECRFRGIDNLWVVDGSFMPTSAAVNPSLTIAANALRVAHGMARAGIMSDEF